MGATVTGIRELSLVIVPVADQDRSLEFYVGSLGLEKRTDVAFGDMNYRWVEVLRRSEPPGSRWPRRAPTPRSNLTSPASR